MLYAEGAHFTAGLDLGEVGAAVEQGRALFPDGSAVENLVESRPARLIAARGAERARVIGQIAALLDGVGVADQEDDHRPSVAASPARCQPRATLRFLVSLGGAGDNGGNEGIPRR